MSAVRLYVDEDASESAVILGLRARGIDLVTTFEAGQLANVQGIDCEGRNSTGRTAVGDSWSQGSVFVRRELRSG